MRSGAVPRDVEILGGHHATQRGVGHRLRLVALAPSDAARAGAEPRLHAGRKDFRRIPVAPRPPWRCTRRGFEMLAHQRQGRRRDAHRKQVIGRFCPQHPLRAVGQRGAGVPGIRRYRHGGSVPRDYPPVTAFVVKIRKVFTCCVRTRVLARDTPEDCGQTPVSVIDTSSNTVIDEITVGAKPFAIVIGAWLAPTGSRKPLSDSYLARQHRLAAG